MRQASSPGLPLWPRLWHTKDGSKCVVKVRHPTWRSYECSYFATEVIIWIGAGVICYATWKIFVTPQIGLRLFFVVLSLALSIPLFSLAMRISLRDMLARVLFATTTKICFTDTAIIFKSRLYATPIVVWRRWHDFPVGLKFIVQDDADAKKYLASRKSDRKWPRAPIDEAAVIDLVVINPSGMQGNLPAREGSGIQRSITVTEVSSRFAQKFTTVFNTAVMILESAEQEQETATSEGKDIDVEPRSIE